MAEDSTKGLALAILGVVALVRYLGGTKQNEADKTPLDILKERYAKGEINKEEFEEDLVNLAAIFSNPLPGEFE